MDIHNQKKLAAKVAGVGIDRISFDSSKLDEIKEAITKADMRALIDEGSIKILPAKKSSRVRARQRKSQQKKGRQKGYGKRKGAAKARARDNIWLKKIRAIRALLKGLRDRNKISARTYHDVYMKSKGGFFRDRGHILFHLKQNNLLLGELKK